MNIPRRCFLDKLTPAEKAISVAIGEVEKAGADARLTDAVVLLSAAKDSVSDFVDNSGLIRRVVVVETVVVVDTKDELGADA